jgi:hypothetical protein
MKSFTDYKGILPYASELFGIYQPLLGWKSKIITERYQRVRATLYNELASRAMVGARTSIQVQLNDTRTSAPSVAVTQLTPFDFGRAVEPRVSNAIDSGIARMIISDVGIKPPSDWSTIITAAHVDALLKQFQSIVSSPGELLKRPDLSAYVDAFSKSYTQTQTQTLFEDLFAKECKVAGYLLFLAQHAPSSLGALFFQTPTSSLLANAQTEDPLLNFGVNSYEAILSPIGIVHLYREYFFEFDSFLGPPVGHVWLSPGGTVELIEVSSRKTTTEQTVSTSLETTTKSETAVTHQDDLADAVKEDNRDNIKFGFSATGSYSAAVYSATATADLAIDNTKETSRETTHKQMREQSEKLSSEIKRNFTTSFKTSTETTDTSSKRYVIQNTTDKLVNYELRRKMRKVGVQVQDIGVALCWHTYVDDAGRDLGVAKLVHIGQPPNLSDLTQPDAPPLPTAQLQEVSITIPFVGIDTDETDEAYTDGYNPGGFLDSSGSIQADFNQRAMFATPGYTLTAVEVDPQGADASLSVAALQSADGASSGSFTIHLNYVNWNGQSQLPVKMTLHWDPGQAVRDAVTAQYNARMTDYTNEKARRYKEAFYSAARERIKLASAITSRPSEDLREEERTVVYRSLVSQLMSVGTHESKHVISELVRSIFDVDKMLYFVAPEWWTPRLHRSAQHLGDASGGTQPASGSAAITTVFPTTPTRRSLSDLFGHLSGVVSTLGSASSGTSITADNTVDWGGAQELNRDNYYITEDSTPAKLGASLGWLLQLDGDNMRNAFLNSPWVKAVIPIRVGKETAALNWLTQAHVEGADGLDATYVAAPNDPPELQGKTIRGALDVLIDKIQDFDQKTRTPIIGNPADPEDSSNHFAGSLPTEAVFEHGFYPLKGGVHFDGTGAEQDIFSQWMEIMPTDQVAALQVEYDPKTLQVKDPPA